MNQVEIRAENSFSEEQKKLIKDLYFKGSTDEEFLLFLHVCKKTGLDPALKQIHPVKRSTKQADGTYKMTMTVQTGIDGYRLIAERTGRYSPGREPTYAYDQNRKLVSATAYVKKQTKDGTWHEVSASAFYDEYCQKDKSGVPTRFWKEMAHSQLAKCAEALALRKAFPGDLSGIYTQDEMQQAAPEDKEDKADTNTITDSQAKEIRVLLDMAQEYKVNNFWNYLKTQLKVSTLEEIPPEKFEIVKRALTVIKTPEREEAIA